MTWESQVQVAEFHYWGWVILGIEMVPGKLENSILMDQQIEKYKYKPEDQTKEWIKGENSIYIIFKDLKLRKLSR